MTKSWLNKPGALTFLFTILIILCFTLFTSMLDSAELSRYKNFEQLNFKSSEVGFMPFSEYSLFYNQKSEIFFLQNTLESNRIVDTIYIPNIPHATIIKINKQPVFERLIPNNLPHNIKSPLIFSFEPISSSVIESISMEIFSSGNLMITSNAYIGNKNDISSDPYFFSPVNISIINISAAATIFIFILVVFLFLENKINLFPLIFLNFILLINELSTYESFIDNSKEYFDRASFILICLSLIETLRATTLDKKYKPLYKIWFVSITFVIFIKLKVSFPAAYLQTVNLLLLTSFSICLLFYTLSSIKKISHQSILPDSLIHSFVLAFVFIILADILIKIGIVKNDIYLSTYLQTLLLPFFVALLALNFLKAHIDTIRINKIISHKVTIQKKRIIEETQRNSFLTEDKLRAKEKSEILADLHDGVLSYLSSINLLTEIKQGKKNGIFDIEKQNYNTQQLIRINKLSRFATQEIRLILDTNAFDNSTLFFTLTSLRVQVLQNITTNRFRYKWDLLNIANYSTANSKFTLNMARIMQECMHNAIVRARCSVISIKAHQNDHGDQYIVISNIGGKSFQPSSINQGYGINNIKRRAIKIAVKYSIKPIKGGARVVLQLPTSK